MKNSGRSFIACSLRKCRSVAWGSRTKLPKWWSSLLPTTRASSLGPNSSRTEALRRYRNAPVPPASGDPPFGEENMTKRATTSLSLHYHVKPGQKEEVLAEIMDIVDRCAKEPEFILAIVHETPGRPNEFAFYEL